jgi:hypothetical protein
MSVLDGVERELKGLPKELRDSGVAEVARALAKRIDEGRGSPSECGKVVLDALSRLRELAPPKHERTKLDDINDELAKKRLAR